jgi:hypothetical protein
MSNKVLSALGGNFRSGAVADVPAPVISEAQARGLTQPPMSAPELAGVGVQFQMNSRYIASLRAVADYRAARADYERKADEALWAKIQARQAAAI